MATPEQDFMEKLAHLGHAPTRARDVPVSLLGQQAARRFLDGETDSLTSAVTEIAEESALGNEHVRRVSEAANQAAWSAALRGGLQKDTQFAPADSEVVLGALDRTPEEMGIPVLDYLTEPPGSTLTPEGDVWALFGMEAPQQEKIASAGAKVGWKDLLKLEGAEDRARSDIDRLTFAMVDAGEDIYKLVKVAYLQEGRGLLQIGAAITRACESEQFGALLTRQLAERLEKDHLVRYTREQEMQKVAQVLVVDDEHPLMAAVAGLERMSALHYTRSQDMNNARAAHRAALRISRTS